MTTPKQDGVQLSAAAHKELAALGSHNTRYEDSKRQFQDFLHRILCKYQDEINFKGIGGKGFGGKLENYLPGVSRSLAAAQQRGGPNRKPALPAAVSGPNGAAGTAVSATGVKMPLKPNQAGSAPQSTTKDGRLAN